LIGDKQRESRKIYKQELLTLQNEHLLYKRELLLYDKNDDEEPF